MVMNDETNDDDAEDDDDDKDSARLEADDAAAVGAVEPDACTLSDARCASDAPPLTVLILLFILLFR